METMEISHLLDEALRRQSQEAARLDRNFGIFERFRPYVCVYMYMYSLYIYIHTHIHIYIYMDMVTPPMIHTPSF